MFFRKISKQLKEQDWTAIWIDLVIVVVGVYLGIQVDNWNEARNDLDRAAASQCAFLRIWSN